MTNRAVYVSKPYREALLCQRVVLQRIQRPECSDGDAAALASAWAALETVKKALRLRADAALQLRYEQGLVSSNKAVGVYSKVLTEEQYFPHSAYHQPPTGVADGNTSTNAASPPEPKTTHADAPDEVADPSSSTDEPIGEDEDWTSEDGVNKTPTDPCNDEKRGY